MKNEIKILTFLKITRSEYKLLSEDQIQLAETVDDISSELFSAYENQPDKRIAVQILGSRFFDVLAANLMRMPEFKTRVADMISELENVHTPEKVEEKLVEDAENSKEIEDILKKIDEIDI